MFLIQLKERSVNLSISTYQTFTADEHSQQEKKRNTKTGGGHFILLFCLSAAREAVNTYAPGGRSGFTNRRPSWARMTDTVRPGGERDIRSSE